MVFPSNNDLAYSAGNLYSGVNVVAVPGTAEQLGTIEVRGPVLVKALTTNGGLVYIGNDGANDVAAGTGIPLQAGQVIIFNYVRILTSLWIDAAVGGEGVAWACLNIY